MSRNLSTTEVSRILGMPEARIRELARLGLCGAGRRGRAYAFSFQDLVVLRAAQELLGRKVPGGRVRRALAALVRELPEDRPLSGLRLYADGRHVAVRDEGTSWLPESGQTVLNFELDELAQRVEELREPESAREQVSDRRGRALREFQRALDTEDETPDLARAAYRRALEIDPDLTDAYVNLGRLAHQAGDAREAARLYTLAPERGPDDPIVHFNLALALEDTRGAGPAAHHYDCALRLDPDFADAHYNLAGVCEKLGRTADAIRHYSAYKKLTET